MDQTNPQDGLSVVEAAAWLGVTEDAVRKRIHRGKIRYTQDADGRYWVYPTEADKRQDRLPESPQDRLIDTLEEQNRFLRGQLEAERDANRENRRIIAALTSRIPELPAPSSQEPSEAPQTATEGPERGVPQEPQEGTQRSWWRRMFGS
jgi:excisionase family DNA binding protein